MADLWDIVQTLETELDTLKATYLGDTTFADIRDLNVKAELGELSLADSIELGRLLKKDQRYETLIDSANFALDYARLASTPNEYSDAEAEVRRATSSISDFLFRKQFNLEYDQNSAILSMRVDVGQADVAPIMFEIFDSYRNFAKSKEMDITDLDLDETSASMLIRGEYAYGYLRGEHGSHKVIYITNGGNGKKQSCYVSVQVEPEIEKREMVIDNDDLKVETLAATGPGGQHCNRSNTGIRITHLLTGISAQSRMRSQYRNRELAMEVLRSRLALHYQDKPLTDGFSSFFGQHIRTYKFPEKMVIERSTREQIPYTDFLDGRLQPFIVSYRNSLVSR